ncbi:MAG TPA: transglycosylase domain-containing protein, partial [Micavibrio sp.]
MTTDNNNGDANDSIPNESGMENLSTSETQPAPVKKRWPKQLKLAFGTAAMGMITAAGYYEFAVSSTLQSKFFKKLHDGEIFTKVVTTPPPAHGNTDVERGYSEVQRIRQQAQAAGDKVSAQVPWKDRQVGPLHLAPIFPRKPQSGITIRDMNGEKMYSGDTPHNYYQKFDDVPEIIVQSFCLVEDKNICDTDKADSYNAAINWWRATQAAGMAIGKKLHITSKIEGGSTLPIQIAKNDSWEKGRTRGLLDKAEQMLTASTDMYALGADTRQQRLNKIVEYINTASFAGHPSFGEIKGLKDAMAVLYGSKDYDQKLRQMNDDAETAKVFRQMFSLVMAVKMPDESLRTTKGYQVLQERIDNFTKLLVDENIITP